MYTFEHRRKSCVNTRCQVQAAELKKLKVAMAEARGEASKAEEVLEELAALRAFLDGLTPAHHFLVISTTGQQTAMLAATRSSFAVSPELHHRGSLPYIHDITACAYSRTNLAHQVPVCAASRPSRRGSQQRMRRVVPHGVRHPMPSCSGAPMRQRPRFAMHVTSFQIALGARGAHPAFQASSEFGSPALTNPGNLGPDGMQLEALESLSRSLSPAGPQTSS